MLTQKRVQQSNVKTSQVKVQEVATNLFPMRGRSSVSTTSNFRRKLNSVVKQRFEGDTVHESMEQSVHPRIDDFLLTQEKTKASEKRADRSPDTNMSRKAIANILNLDQLCISTSQTPNHQQFEQGKFAISAKTQAEDAQRQTVLTHQQKPNFVRKRNSKNARPHSKGTDHLKFKKLNPKVSKDQQSNQKQSVLNDLVNPKARVMTQERAQLPRTRLFDKCGISNIENASSVEHKSDTSHIPSFLDQSQRTPENQRPLIQMVEFKTLGHSFKHQAELNRSRLPHKPATLDADRRLVQSKTRHELVSEHEQVYSAITGADFPPYCRISRPITQHAQTMAPMDNTDILIQNNPLQLEEDQVNMDTIHPLFNVQNNKTFC